MFAKPQDVLTGLSKQSMTSTSHGSSKIEPNHWRETARDLNAFYAIVRALEGLMDILAFLVDKLRQKWWNINYGNPR